jgi:flagellar biosynthesis/type III secretory pathway protein FliH
MKTSKGFLLLATASLLGLSVSCSDRYQEGFAAGKDQGYKEGYDNGYDDGYADGDSAGFERAKAYFASADYNKGFADGKTSGIQIGYQQGYTAGQSSVNTTQIYNNGYSAGQAAGYSTGYAAGRTVGYSLGYDDGYDDGALDGYDLGYDDGYADGYDAGYDDGYSDGWYRLSVGKTKALRGYANILSMAHNDLFDYSKIPAPKATARGLFANGKLLLEETSLTNKDTLKRAAVVEQYLVVEMSKQVQSKFGLSAVRSLRIAKAANHFRKYSAKGLTKEDTNAYISEVIGADISSIEEAYDNGSMSSVLQAAAFKNGTTPEKMTEIVLKNFL